MDGESDELAALIGRCGRQDKAAFRTLYDLTSARLYGSALRLTRQPAAAADVVHDTFLQLWQNAARFDPERGTPEAWLTTLLRYRAIDATRRTAREHPEAELQEIVDEQPDALAVLLGRDDARALHACLEALEPTQRRAVALAFFEGYSHGQLAAHLAAPLGTVKSWVRRALSSLRHCLDAGIAT